MVGIILIVRLVRRVRMKVQEELGFGPAKKDDSKESMSSHNSSRRERDERRQV